MPYDKAARSIRILHLELVGVEDANFQISCRVCQEEADKQEQISKKLNATT